MHVSDILHSAFASLHSYQPRFLQIVRDHDPADVHLLPEIHKRPDIPQVSCRNCLVRHEFISAVCTCTPAPFVEACPLTYCTPLIQRRVIETAHTVFCIQFIYDYLIKDFGNYFNFIVINWYVHITSDIVRPSC